MRHSLKREEANEGAERWNESNTNTDDVKIILCPQDSTVDKPREKQPARK